MEKITFGRLLVLFNKNMVLSIRKKISNFSLKSIKETKWSLSKLCKGLKVYLEKKLVFSKLKMKELRRNKLWLKKEDELIIKDMLITYVENIIGKSRLDWIKLHYKELETIKLWMLKKKLLRWRGFGEFLIDRLDMRLFLALS